MGFAHDGGVDVVLTHPVRAVRPLNFIPSRISLRHSCIIIFSVSHLWAFKMCVPQILIDFSGQR